MSQGEFTTTRWPVLLTGFFIPAITLGTLLHIGQFLPLFALYMDGGTLLPGGLVRLLFLALFFFSLTCGLMLMGLSELVKSSSSTYEQKNIFVRALLIGLVAWSIFMGLLFIPNVQNNYATFTVLFGWLLSVTAGAMVSFCFVYSRLVFGSSDPKDLTWSRVFLFQSMGPGLYVCLASIVATNRGGASLAWQQTYTVLLPIQCVIWLFCFLSVLYFSEHHIFSLEEMTLTRRKTSVTRFWWGVSFFTCRGFVVLPFLAMTFGGISFVLSDGYTGNNNVVAMPTEPGSLPFTWGGMACPVYLSAAPLHVNPTNPNFSPYGFMPILYLLPIALIVMLMPKENMPVISPPRSMTTTRSHRFFRDITRSRGISILAGEPFPDNDTSLVLTLSAIIAWSYC